MPPSSGDRLASGDRLGPYEIIAPIGAGGMGEVYRARDTRLGREVAVKILPAHLANNPQALVRFEREGKAVAALSHPNILTLFDVGEQGGIHYVVTELLEGETLRDRLKRGPLPWRKTADLGIALADGLAAAHDKQLTHRDIKPANIFLTTNGQVKILDFGLARFQAPTPPKPAADDATITMHEAQYEQTEVGTILGTAAYMSPEQVHGETAGPPSDIFSLGSVLYEMVAGRQPFSGKSSADVMAGILKENPPVLADTGAQMPAEFERVIDKCLSKNPSERFQSGHDLASALRGLAGASEPSTQVVPPVPRPLPRGSRLRTSVAIAALLLILAAAGLYYWRSHNAQTIRTIAVLPFSNLSGSPDTDYLSDGITESVLDSLAELPNLKVMSRSAVMRYKGKDPDVPAVGRDLGVRAVLTGRITQHGDNLTVTTELVDANDNSRLWGEQYNRKLADALAVQNDIAHQIVVKLQLRLSDTQAKHMVTRQTANPEAYQLYLKGRYFTAQFSPESLDKGLNYFKQAIALDPNYALAYDGLSYYYGQIDELLAAPSDVMPKAVEAAQKAMELDDSLVEPHVEQAGNYTFYNFDWPAAEHEFQRAFSINSDYAPAHQYYSWYLLSQGRNDQAIQEGQRAVDLDPLSAEIHSFLGWVFFMARRYDQAAAEGRKTLELDPNYGMGHWQLGAVETQEGKLEDAIAEQRKAAELFSALSEPQAELARNYALQGKLPEARQILQDLMTRSKTSYVGSYGIATVYAALGEKDQAFERLDQAYEQRSVYLTWLKVDPRLDTLRSDPRFQSLLARMKLQ